MGLYFIISAIFYSVMLNFVYHSKQHVDSAETKMFSYILGLNLVGLILELLCTLCGYSGHISLLFSAVMTRLYLLYLMVFLLLFTLYIYTICYKTSKNSKVSYYSALKKVSYIIFYLASVVMIFMPLLIHPGYAEGMAVDFVYACSAICMDVWLISMIKNFKKIKIQKFIPIASFILLASIGAIIQKSNPSFTVMTAMQTFVIFLMFFTIENPDVKMIKELEIAREQSDQASKAKTEFLSNMSHEIRTPLNAIIGFSNSLLEDTKDPKVTEDAKYIVSASESLLELVNGILDITKIEENKIEIIENDYDIEEMLDDLVAITKARINDKPITFKTHFDRDLPSVLRGDAFRLKQICLNLLTNAVKYTNSGYIDFKVDSVIKGDTVRLIISVTDSGSGIKSEDIDKLFTKFSRLELEKNISIEGTGLGLAITKKLVEMMNGKIVCTSEYGVGSKFIVAVDQKVSNAESLVKPLKENLEKEQFKTYSDKRILVVDDNLLNLKVAEKILEPYNVNVKLAHSGNECIDMITKETYDLVLMDDMMPEKTGSETLVELKRKFPGYSTPTVVLTANAINGMKEQYLSNGFDDYLAKPIEKIELERVLNKYLR